MLRHLGFGRRAAVLFVFILGCGGSHESSDAPDAGASGADAAAGAPDGSPGVNEAPVADAGSDLAVDTGSTVMLSGAGSSDPDGDTLSFSWRLASTPNGSNAALLNADKEGPSFVADRSGNYIIELTVSDGELDSDPDTVTITAAPSGTNLKPIADAGDDLQAVTGQTTVQLDGTGSSDPEGASLNYLWVRKSFPAGSTASLNTNDPATPTFVPDLDGEYVFRLQVNDGETVSDIDEVSVFADSQDQIAIVSGDGQSGVVNTTMTQPIVAEVTNAYDMPVAGVSVAFQITAGDGSVSALYGYTNASGQASTSLTVGKTAGANQVTAACTSCETVTSAAASATGNPDVPAQVVFLDPPDVPVAQTMPVTLEVIDQYGNLVTSDNSTRFTVTVQGDGAVSFDSATTGTIVSGTGTTSAEVQVSGGKVVLRLSDDTAEAVTFTASDTDGNGLEYLGTLFDKTSSTQTLACDGVNSFSFDVSGLGPFTSDGLVEVSAIGGLGSSLEVINMYLESYPDGDSFGEVFGGSNGAYCSLVTDSFTVPMASLQTYAADGTIGIDGQVDFFTDCYCGTNEVSARLTVEAQPQGTFF